MIDGENLDTLDIKGAAKLLHLGYDAMKALIDDGAVPAVSLNQKHVVMLRDDLIAYVREEGRRQADARKRLRIKPARERTNQDGKPVPPSRRRALPNLDGYLLTTS